MTTHTYSPVFDDDRPRRIYTQKPGPNGWDENSRIMCECGGDLWKFDPTHVLEDGRIVGDNVCTGCHKPHDRRSLVP